MERPLNPRQLEAFVAVVRAGTTVAAARLLGTSQPSVSRLLSELEAAVQMRLFSRNGRRLVPTAEGTLFHAEVERYFLGAAELANRAREIRTFADIELRIATIAAGALDVVPDAIAELTSDREQDLRASVFLRSHFRVLEMVATQQVDLGLCNSATGNDAVQVRSSWRLPCLMALPVGHRLAHRRTLYPEDIEGEDFISLGDEFYARSMTDAAAMETLRRNTRRKANLSLAVCRLVAAGLGIGLIDPLTADLHGPLGIAVRPFEPAVAYPVSIVEPLAARASDVRANLAATLADRLHDRIATIADQH